ncbi:MAG: biotin/lipoyl-containing protein [Anaerovoracaceae bacterium]|jgi:multidrug efflux pump subunit AcrA (membrane-fusion protein)
MAELFSPLTGKIQEVNMKVGQMVTEGDQVMVIEATKEADKKESTVYGENGVVKEIFVNVGDSVSENEVLAIIE